MPSTAIVAEPYPGINQTIPEVVSTTSPDTWMKIDPWFDWSPILGIPLWVFIGIFLVFVMLVVIIYWMVRLKRMRPAKGYVDAGAVVSSNNDDEAVMAWIISTTKNLTMKCLQKRDSVLSFYDPINITKWVHTTPFSVIHVGGKGGVLVSEDYYRTRDMVSEMALTYAIENFNANIEKLKKQLGDKIKVASQIKDYDDYERFGRELLGMLYPDGIEMPSYCIYDPNRMRRFFPEGYTAKFHGGVFIREARDLNIANNRPSFWEKVLPFGFIAVFVVMTTIAAWMVPL